MEVPWLLRNKEREMMKIEGKIEKGYSSLNLL
jgi:hypothetical protein